MLVRLCSGTAALQLLQTCPTAAPQLRKSVLPAPATFALQVFTEKQDSWMKTREIYKKSHEE